MAIRYPPSPNQAYQVLREKTFVHWILEGIRYPVAVYNNRVEPQRYYMHYLSPVTDAIAAGYGLVPAYPLITNEYDEITPFDTSNFPPPEDGFYEFIRVM